jgi:hypothetical protein
MLLDDALAITMTQATSNCDALDAEGARAYQAARAGIEWGVYRIVNAPAACFGTASPPPRQKRHQRRSPLPSAANGLKHPALWCTRFSRLHAIGRWEATVLAEEGISSTSNVSCRQQWADDASIE